MMAITRPVVDTEISATLFGQPVYDILKFMPAFSGEGTATGIGTAPVTIPNCSYTWTASTEFSYVVLGYARITVSTAAQRAIVQLMSDSAERGRVVDYAFPTGASALGMGTCFEFITGVSGSQTRFLRGSMAGGSSGTFSVDLARMLVLRLSA